MFASLKRGLPRIMLLAVIGNILLGASNLVPLLLGPIMAPLAFGFGLCFMGLAVGDVGMRILQPKVDAQSAAKTAITENCTGAGLVYLGRCILAAAILMLIVTSPRAAEPPKAALAHLPVLKAELQKWWPDMPLPSALGAQVEQETCYSLTHSRCWSPRAELRTSRERGVGLGQITKTMRFDSLAELRQQFPAALGAWQWDNASLYDPALQLRGMILMDLRNFRAVKGASNELAQLAFSFAAYNGGQGGLASDRRVCAATKGCDPGRWFGHVEHTSLKQKTAVAGYGQSFFQINREYVRNILVDRRLRYLVLDA